MAGSVMPAFESSAGVVWGGRKKENHRNEMIPHSCDSFSWETRLPQIIFHPAKLISDKQNLPMAPQQSEPGFHHAVLPFHLQKRCILRNGFFLVTTAH